MMQLIRSNAGKYIVFPIILLFLGWMVFEIGANVAGVGPTARPGELGRVNGQVVTAEAYNRAFEQLVNARRQQTGQDITPEERLILEEQAWDQVVNDILIRQELARRGIRVSDAEILQAARTYPYPEIANQDIFLTNGVFDLQKYQRFLSDPSVDASLLLAIENYFRDALPQTKLARQLSAGLYVSDAELWRAFQDRNETATVEFVSLDLTRLAPGDAPVTDAEIRRYYDENRERFERPAEAVVSVAWLPQRITAADSLYTLQLARDLKAEIQGGADFAEIATRQSVDPVSAREGGSLGEFRRGQFVAPFDSAVWALPLNTLSDPVVTQFGVHLIEVTARADSTATARHILLEFEKDPEALNALDAKADSLEDLAGRSGLERAARLVGAQFSRGLTLTGESPFLPGVGPAAEVLDWAEGAADGDGGGRNALSDVFNNDSALFVAQLERYRPAGVLSLADATPEIRRILILEKKRDQAAAEGARMVAEIRAGQSLQQVAQRRGLTVQTAGPFTRVEPNPALGQANAAIGAAFGTPVGQVSDVARTPQGLFLVRPTSRTQADRAAFEAQKEMQRQDMRAQLEQVVVRRWLESVRKEADIEDNRDELQRRARAAEAAQS